MLERVFQIPSCPILCNIFNLGRKTCWKKNRDEIEKFHWREKEGRAFFLRSCGSSWELETRFSLLFTKKGKLFFSLQVNNRNFSAHNDTLSTLVLCNNSLWFKTHDLMWRVPLSTKCKATCRFNAVGFFFLVIIMNSHGGLLSWG